MGTKVLDHGFVELHNISGPIRRRHSTFDADDIDPALSARMSFGKFDQDRPRATEMRLVKYLMQNRHNTPIEMVEVWLEMKMPIFVARQFVRHRTATINEVSARYIELPAEFYIPKPEHVGIKPKHIKQGREMLPWDETNGEQKAIIDHFLKTLRDNCEKSYSDYQEAIDLGIPNELARCHLHVNHYTHWLWKQDLHNVLHFLSRRLDDHAQYEAQQYAIAVRGLIAQHLPGVIELFDAQRANLHG